MTHFEDETQPEPICAACNKPWPCPDAGIDDSLPSSHSADDLRFAAIDVADWWDTTHGNGFHHDHHCPLGRGDDSDVPGDPDACTCGWAKAKPALDRLSLLTTDPRP